MPRERGLVGLLAAALAPERAQRRPLAVALSGGRDSTVLLHALHALQGAGGLRALHVEHDLQSAAAGWARHCELLCAGLGVPFTHLRVQVPRAAGRGLEAAAREARYTALFAALAADEALLTAHHRGDQLETLLMHLRRGSGVDGMAGIPVRSEVAGRLLLRPLLDADPQEIARYAAKAGLRFVEDPSNEDRAVDRSFLRHEVLPVLTGRWPDFTRGAARAAGWLSEAAGLLRSLAAADHVRLASGSGLELAGCAALPPARQRLLLRHLCREQGLPLPGEAALRRGLPGLLAAGSDRNPRLCWPGAELRRYRDRLYLLPASPAQPPPGGLRLRPGATLALGGQRGQLALVRADAGGLAVPEEGLELRWRQGGERLRPAGQAHHRALKLLFQERGVVPWMRGQVPLLYAGGRLAAVADLWLADAALAGPGEPGWLPRWDGHGALG